MCPFKSENPLSAFKHFELSHMLKIGGNKGT